jgi:hypothetical protein
MRKIAKIILFSVLFFSVLYLNGCSSGEYDIEQYDINYVETKVKIDTLYKINGDNIGTDRTNLQNTLYKFSVQVGAFVTPSYFENFYAQARQVLGNEIYYEVQNNLYKIRIGSFNNRSEADKLVDLAKSKGYFDAFIIIKKR